MNPIMAMYNNLEATGKIRIPNFQFKSEAKSFVQNLRVIHSRQQATLQKIGLYTEADKLSLTSRIEEEPDGTFTAYLELSEKRAARFSNIKSFYIIAEDGTEEEVKLPE